MIIIDPKLCDLCGKKAMYHVGRIGFCFNHKREAVEATSREKNRIMSQMGLERTLGENHGSPRRKPSIGNTEACAWRGWDFDS